MGNQNKNYKTRKETQTSINNSTKWSALSCYSSCQRSSSAVCTGSGAGCSERNNNPKLRSRSRLQKTLTLMRVRKKPPRASALTTSSCGYSDVKFLRKSNYKTKDKVKGRFLLDVVVRKGTAIFELFAGKDQSLLIWGNSLLILDLGLDIFPMYSA